MPGNIIMTTRKEYGVRKVHKLVIQFPNPESAYSVTLTSFKAEPGVHFFTEEELAGGLFPFDNKFGQYKHEEWEGKLHSVEELNPGP